MYHNDWSSRRNDYCLAMRVVMTTMAMTATVTMMTALVGDAYNFWLPEIGTSGRYVSRMVTIGGCINDGLCMARIRGPLGRIVGGHLFVETDQVKEAFCRQPLTFRGYLHHGLERASSYPKA